jgi:hypothetical protein
MQLTATRGCAVRGFTGQSHGNAAHNKSAMIDHSADIPEFLNGPYSVRHSGNVGQEIIDADGIIVFWTCNTILAAVIAQLLNRLAGIT